MSTLKIEEKFTVAAPVERVWQFLLSPELVAGCLPGAALRGQEGADTYLGTMKIKVGPVTSEFKGKATMSDIDPAAHRLKLTGTGDDVSGGGSARMSMELGVREAAEGSEVQVVADVEIAGKLVRFGRGMIEGVSKQLFKQFVERARERIARVSEAAAPRSGPEAPAAATEDVPVNTPVQAVGSPPEAAPAAVAPQDAASPAAPSAPAAPPADAAASTAAAASPAEPSTAAAATANEAASAASNATTAEASAQPAADTNGASEAPADASSSPGPAAKSAGSAAVPGASGRGPAPAPEPSDITTGVLPRPKPRPMAITVPKQEPEALDAGSLVFRALWEWVKSLFRRLLGRGS